MTLGQSFNGGNGPDWSSELFAGTEWSDNSYVDRAKHLDKGILVSDDSFEDFEVIVEDTRTQFKRKLADITNVPDDHLTPEDVADGKDEFRFHLES